MRASGSRPRLVSESSRSANNATVRSVRGVQETVTPRLRQRDPPRAFDRAFGSEGARLRGVEISTVETRAIGLRRLGRRLAVRPIRASRLD